MLSVSRFFSAKRVGWTIHALGSISLVATAAVIELVAVEPMRQQSASTCAEIDRLESLAAKGRNIREQFDKARKEHQLQVAHQRALRDRVPDEPMEAEFLAQLAQLARTYDLRVAHYQPGVVTRRADYSEVQIELQGEGTYEGLSRFVDQIPHLPRLSSVTEMEIQSQPEKPMYSFHLKFSVYFMPMNNKGRGASS